MTGLLPNLVSIILHQQQHPDHRQNSSPHNTQTLSGNCHHRSPSCVTRLAVMRLSVSGSMSWRKSSATLDELQTSHPPSVGRNSRKGNREGKKELKVQKGTKRLWRLAVTMVILLSVQTPYIPRHPSLELTNCFCIRQGKCLRGKMQDSSRAPFWHHCFCQKYLPSSVITRLKFWFDCLYLAFWVWPFP